MMNPPIVIEQEEEGEGEEEEGVELPELEGVVGEAKTRNATRNSRMGISSYSNGLIHPLLLLLPWPQARLLLHYPRDPRNRVQTPMPAPVPLSRLRFLLENLLRPLPPLP